MNRNKTEEDVRDWKYKYGDSIRLQRDLKVPHNYVSLVRHVIRNIILEKKKLPTRDLLLEKLNTITVSDAHHLNLFQDQTIPEKTKIIWKWSSSTLYRLMKRHGFIHNDQLTH